MATHTTTVLADDQPISTVATDTTVVIETQRRFTRSQAKKEGEQRFTILKSKHTNGSLYHEMQEWQDKFDEVSGYRRVRLHYFESVRDLLVANNHR